jgi:tetratricopeptide (TPR) repeat protein
VLLETIREFAAEQLEEQGNADVIGRRHASFCAALCEHAEPHFTGNDQRAWLDRFELEQDNLRAALRRSIDAGDAETGLRILAAVWRFWQQRGFITEGRQWARELRTLPAEGLPAELRARAAGAAGNLAYWQADAGETTPLYREQLEFAEASGDERLLLDAHFNTALLATFAGDFSVFESVEAGLAALRVVLEEARRIGDRQRLSSVLDAVAYTLYVHGDYEESLRYNEEARALAREVGNHFVLSETTHTTGQIYRALGDYGRSREAYVEALRLTLEDGNLIGLIMVLKMLAALEAQHGHYEDAARLLGTVGSAVERYGTIAPDVAYQIGDTEGTVRAALGDAELERLFRIGYATDVDACVSALVTPSGDQSPSP